MTEAQLLAEVIALCDHLGLLWHHDPDSRRVQGSPGFPDLIIAGRQWFIFRELKSETGDTSPDQDLWAWHLTRVHLGLWGIWRPSDLESGKIRRELEEMC